MPLTVWRSVLTFVWDVLVSLRRRFLQKRGVRKIREWFNDFQFEEQYPSRWWFQTFFMFTPILGEMIQIWRAYFSDGWLNHQLDCEMFFFFNGLTSPPRNIRSHGIKQKSRNKDFTGLEHGMLPKMVLCKHVFYRGDPHVDLPKIGIVNSCQVLTWPWNGIVRSPFQRLSDFKLGEPKGLFHHLVDGVSGCYFVGLWFQVDEFWNIPIFFSNKYHEN